MIDIEEGKRLLARLEHGTGPGDSWCDEYTDWCRENGRDMIEEIEDLRAKFGEGGEHQDLREKAVAAGGDLLWEFDGDTVITEGNIYIICSDVRKEDGEFIAAASPKVIIKLIDDRNALFKGNNELLELVKNWEKDCAELEEKHKLLKARNRSARSKIEGMVECHNALHKVRPEGVQCICEEML